MGLNARIRKKRREVAQLLPDVNEALAYLTEHGKLQKHHEIHVNNYGAARRDLEQMLNRRAIARKRKRA
jgi:hypothetical protein